MKYSQSFQINAPIASVWQIMADVERYPDWAPTFEKAEFLGGKTLAEGLRVRLWVKGTPPSEFVVMEFTGGSRFAWETKARGVHARADHLLEASAGGTRLTLTVDTSGFMATLFVPMLKRVSVRNLALEGNALKAQAEALVAA